MFWKTTGHVLECVGTIDRPNRMLETYRSCESETKRDSTLSSRAGQPGDRRQRHDLERRLPRTHGAGRVLLHVPHQRSGVASIRETYARADSGSRAYPTHTHTHTQHTRGRASPFSAFGNETVAPLSLSLSRGTTRAPANHTRDRNATGTRPERRRFLEAFKLLDPDGLGWVESELLWRMMNTLVLPPHSSVRSFF